MKKFLCLIILSFFTGCTHLTFMDLSPEEHAYLEKVRQFPLEFTIPDSDSVPAWGRAQSFIGKYSYEQLKIATDYILQSEHLLYNVTKTAGKDSFTITVQCFSPGGSDNDDLSLNAHILAYYIKSGELPFPRLISTNSYGKVE